MRSTKNPEKTKKSKGNTIFILVVILITAICLFLWKFGFGTGGGNGIGTDSGTGDVSLSETVSSASESETDNEEAAEETLSENNPLYVEIIVTEDKITVDGREMSDKATLKDYLLENHHSDEGNNDGTKYTLIDSRGLKSAYDDAKSVLDELGYEYSERTAEE